MRVITLRSRKCQSALQFKRGDRMERVELHCHTYFSRRDGVLSVYDISLRKPQEI